jgi:hypothetical protein
MSAPDEIGRVNGWRYVVRQDGDHMFVIVRQHLPDDILEDEVAFCFSREIAHVIGLAVVECERRKEWEKF